jgi:hypothetical protein
MIWRKKSPDSSTSTSTSSAGVVAEPVLRCRHCGNPRVKLTYRRYDEPPGGAHALTLIYRCAGCDQFTTVRTGT